MQPDAELGPILEPEVQHGAELVVWPEPSLTVYKDHYPVINYCYVGQPSIIVCCFYELFCFTLAACHGAVPTVVQSICTTLYVDWSAC